MRRLAFSVNASPTLAAIRDRDAEILEDEDGDDDRDAHAPA
jgi:hypothetical protein